MSELKIGSITVIVNGYIINNGLPYFQKAVPTALRTRIGKANIKIRLRDENGNYAVQCHRLDLRYAALFRAMNNDGSIVPSEAKLAGVAMIELLGLKQGEGLEEFRIPLPDGRVDVLLPARDILDDFLTYNDFKPSAVTSAAFAALDNKLPVLLSEAFPVYLDNHQKGKDKKFIDNQKQHWDKLVNLLGDKPIKAVTRQDAKGYRDHRLASGVSPTTVAREINVIKAVFAKAIRELSLGIANQFSSIEIPKANQNAKDRIPYTNDEIELLVSQAQMQDDEKRRIVLVLAFTGARLAEIVGLRKMDFDAINGSILIREHGGRSLKNKSSEREVPLLPIALKAVENQAISAKGGYLFPTYASDEGTKADSASAALNKWAKTHVGGKSMHCFRHSLRDLMRTVMCPESVAKEIGGWSATHDVSVQYGQGYPIEVKRKWLSKAYAWLIQGGV